MKLDANTALWWTCVYLAYYHLGSAAVAWTRYPEPEYIRKQDWQDDLFYFKQRRCFRGNTHARDQLNTILKMSDGDLKGWVDSLIGNGGERGWTRLRAAMSDVPYHGPWSSYKFCDLMKFTHKYPITAPDIGNKPGSSAGPIAGLTTITGMDWKQVCDDNQMHRDLLEMVKDFDCPANGLDHLESLLCDWQSVTHGRYYAGHDIDRDLKQLHECKEPNKYSKMLWKIRADLFDDRLRGELSDWTGPRKELKTVYRDRRRIVNDFSDVQVVEL